MQKVEIEFYRNLAIFDAPKNSIDFRKIFSWENLFGKSPYYEKGKQGK